MRIAGRIACLELLIGVLVNGALEATLRLQDTLKVVLLGTYRSEDRVSHCLSLLLITDTGDCRSDKDNTA